MQSLTRIYGLLFICLLLNIALWAHFRTVQVKWLNVPPVPAFSTAVGFGAGDEQLAFRNIALILQNLGDSGGKARSFEEYDYERLSEWLRLAYSLDRQSSYIPYMAAYYFSAVQDTQKLPPLIAFLEEIGKTPGRENWRWLVQAIFLARYRLEDNDWALRMAQRLRAMSAMGSKMPVWAANMDVMIMNVKGDKEAAYTILLQTLQSEGDHMEPNEKYFILDQICNTVLQRSEALNKPFCNGILGKT